MPYDTQEVKQDDLMVPSGLKVYESMNTEQIQEMENKLPTFLKKMFVPSNGTKFYSVI